MADKQKGTYPNPEEDNFIAQEAYAQSENLFSLMSKSSSG